MPFIRPAIHVYQQLMTITPRTISPYFELCIVGPAYQVKRNVRFPDYYSKASGDYVTPYSEKDAGTIVVPESINAILKNVKVQVWPDSTSAVQAEAKVSNSGPATMLYFDGSATFSAAGVRAGDLLDVTYNNLTYSSIVQSLTTTQQLVDGEMVARESLILQRNIPTPNLGAVTAAGCTTTLLKFSTGAVDHADYYNGMTVTINGVTKNVIDYSYAGGVGTLTLDTALAEAPAADVAFVIYGVGAQTTIYRPVAKKIWPMRYSTTNYGAATHSTVNSVTRLTFAAGDLSTINMRDSVRVVYTRASESETYLSQVGAVNTTGTKYIDLIDSIPAPGVGVSVAVYVTTSEFRHNVTLDNSGGLSRITTDVGSKFNAAGVSVRDRVRLYDGNNEYDAEVYSLSADGRTITLSTKVDIGGQTYGVVQAIINRDEIDQYVLNNVEYTAGADTFSVDGQIKLVVDNRERLIYNANLYMDYKALRAGNGEFVSVNTSADAEAAFGDIDPDNPLAIACSIVQANTGATYKVLPLTEDSTQGYLDALDTLSTSNKVYVIVPLTQDKDVVSAYASHCAMMSTPEKSKWRVTYANLKLPVTKVMVELNSGSLAPGAEDYLYLKDTVNGTFVSSRCAAGDYVELYTNAGDPAPMKDANGNAYALKVKEVVNDTVAKVYKTLYTVTSEGYAATTSDYTIVPDDGGSEQSINYEVRRTLSTQGISEEMVSIAQSFKNKRLRLVQPDEVILRINNIDYIMPGYYLCVAYGAMRAGLPPHQGFTTLGVAGISRILHSNKKFKDTQLDEMAGGGVFWVVQDEPEALPYCIYQTTTDTTQLETIEDSVVATIDYTSMYFRDNLKSVLGKFNVNEISLNYVASIIKDISEKLMRTSYPYIGAILTEGKLKSISAEADKIKPVVAIKVPFPVNSVDLYLEI